MEVITKAGISWRLARTWEGGRDLEMRLKRRHNGCRLCPICKAEKLIEAMYADLVVESEEDNQPTLW